MSHLIVDVHGLPAPQGSKRAFVNRATGRAHVVENNAAKVQTWRDDVKAAVLEARRTRGAVEPFTGPVHVELDFYFPRPKGHFRTGRNAHLLRDQAPHHPAGKPDLDKLIRSTFDAVTAAGLWPDDKLVVSVQASKTYTDGNRHVGARIWVREAVTSDANVA